MKKASHETQKPIDSSGPSGRRPSPSMACHAMHRQRRSISIATSGGRPPSVPTRDISARPRWHAPVRKSANQSWWPFRPCDRVRPRVLTHPLRDEARTKPPLLAARHGTARRFTSPAPAWRGLSLSPRTGAGSPSPHGGSEERRAGADGRRVRVRVLGDRRRPRAHSALRSLPRPADTADPARPLHCVESCMEMEAQGFTSNPTDLCLCPSQSVCLSVRSVHPFSLDDGRAAIHHRSWPAACTSAPRPNRKHRTFPSHVKTRRRLSVGHGVRSCIVCHHLTWSTINTDFSERVRALCALHICTGPVLRAPHSCFGTCFRTMTMLSYTRESLLLQEDGADGGVSWHGSKNFALSG